MDTLACISHRDPLTGSNAGDCAGFGAVAFDDTPVTGPVTCAASTSITVDTALEVQSTGDLELIAPTVELTPGFEVDDMGKLSVIPDDPAAP